MKAKVIPFDTLLRRFTREAARLGLVVRRRTVEVELGCLFQNAQIQLVRKEWGRGTWERYAAVELVYAPELASAAADADGRLDPGRAFVPVTVQFKLFSGGTVPVDGFTARVKPLFDAVSAAFPEQKLQVRYTLTSNFRDHGPHPEGAEVGVPVSLFAREGELDLGFLVQVSNALQELGPGERLY